MFACYFLFQTEWLYQLKSGMHQWLEWKKPFSYAYILSVTCKKPLPVDILEKCKPSGRTTQKCLPSICNWQLIVTNVHVLRDMCFASAIAHVIMNWINYNIKKVWFAWVISTLIRWNFSLVVQSSPGMRFYKSAVLYIMMNPFDVVGAIYCIVYKPVRWVYVFQVSTIFLFCTIACFFGYTILRMSITLKICQNLEEWLWSIIMMLRFAALLLV